MSSTKRVQKYQDQLNTYFEKNQNHPILSKMLVFNKRLKEWESRQVEKEDSLEEYPKSRKLTNPTTGDTVYTWDNKLHNWDGPALIPEGDKKRAEYHLYGIQYSFEEWKEMKQQWEGLPWFKTPSILLDHGGARH